MPVHTKVKFATEELTVAVMLYNPKKEITGLSSTTVARVYRPMPV